VRHFTRYRVKWRQPSFDFRVSMEAIALYPQLPGRFHRAPRSPLPAYAEAWRSANSLARRPRAHEIDARLHDERVDSRTRRQITRPTRCGDLPAGTMIRHDGTVGLVVPRSFLPWSHTGYGPGLPLPDRAELLTPPASVAALRAGYHPALHPSAEY
jgi:hypothetical protein